MKNLKVNSIDDIKIVNIPIPKIKENEALIRTLWCGLCTSDIVKIKENVKKPLGHEYIGIVEEVGKNISKVKKFDLINVMHHVSCYECDLCKNGSYTMCKKYQETHFFPQGFSEYMKISSDQIEHNTNVIYDKKDIKKYVFAEPVGCCLRAIERLKIQGKNRNVLVFGCGVMGIIFISLFRLLYKYSFIAAVDINNDRLPVAKKFGADVCINPKEEDLDSRLKYFSINGFDIAFLTIISEDIMSFALKNVKKGGSIELFTTTIEGKAIKFDIDSLFNHEANIITTFSGDSFNFKRGFSLLEENKINLLDLISYELPIEEMQKGFNLALNGKALKNIFYFNKELVSQFQ
jgi:L-iditol 2-dehydrogenase